MTLVMAPPTQESDRPATLRLAVPAEFTSVRAAAAKVREFLENQGVPESELFACELCVTEGGNNAVEYSSGRARGLRVSVEAVCGETQLEFRIGDHTMGFNCFSPRGVPTVLAERGRGLFLIHSFMDEVLYLRGAKENVLIMRKQRKAGANGKGSIVAQIGLEECRREIARLREASSGMVHELDVARMIQRSLLPAALPQVRGFGLAGGWNCAREVSGDFYGAIALGEYTSLLIVADAMGKGVPAALFATNFRGVLRGLSARFNDPAQLLGRLNRLLYDELFAVGMFITAQVAFIDVRTRKVTAAGAGHCPLLYVSDKGNVVKSLATEGMALGVMLDTEFAQQTVTLGHPGILLMHTDGVTDTRNAQGERFGQDRLAAWLSVNHGHGRSATELSGRLSNELNRYRGDTEMTDDQAFLLLAEDSPYGEGAKGSRAPFERKGRRKEGPAVA
jgi:serine phosphatase RsbU (regulator of sigma subunit)/anti-sigma regulatory factor (Ser/Thr protein kinase)